MWDKIKGAIWEEDKNAPPKASEDPLAKHVQAPPQDTNPPQNSRLVPYANGGQPAGRGSVYGAAPPVPSSVMPYTPQPQVNEAMVAAIRKATFSRNTALTSLIQAADSLSDVVPDPVMRLKAAQKMGGGRNAKEMADAVSIHLNDVDGEVMRFQQAMKTQHDKDVATTIKEAERTEEAARRQATEAEQLVERINQLKASAQQQFERAVDLRNTAATADNVLKSTEAEFQAAAQYVRDELNTHKTTILSTLT